jgi:hypothetical protein
MTVLVFDAPKDIVSFEINGTDVVIHSHASTEKFYLNPKTFQEQAATRKARMQLRRRKGETWFSEWEKDLEKFRKMDSEVEIVNDIMTDFHEKLGWRLVKRA